MESRTFYLITTDTFDDRVISEDGSCLNIHENIGLFLDGNAALQRYGQTTGQYRNRMAFQTKEVSPASLYPESFTDFDRCFIADGTPGGDLAEHPVHNCTTLLKLDIEEGVPFDMAQDSYCMEFRICSIGEYNIPIATAIFQDEEKGIPEGLDRIPVIR